MYHANKCIIFASSNYCYKTDRQQYNDSIMAYFFQNSVDWQFTSSPKGGGWNYTYGCSQVSYNWTGVSEPSRLTQASSGGGQVLQSTRHVTTKHSVYEFQISVCYWPNLAT